MNRKEKLDWFSHFDKRPRTNALLLFALYLFVNNSINATSDWMEHNRAEGTPQIALWEPFVWEYSSALSTLLALPIVLWFVHRYPPAFANPIKWLSFHAIGTLCFSAVHVFMMVMMRKGVYQLADRHYDFGSVPIEFLYEYRKDAWGYVFITACYLAGKFVYSRIKGEANLINDSEFLEKELAPEHLLVKKLDKEFLLKIADIEWMESAGNYVNLYVKGRIYPLRATLKNTCDKLQTKGFSRTHRSYAINHNFVESISTQVSGDGEIKMHDGQTIPLSRRYKTDFKQNLS